MGFVCSSFSGFPNTVFVHGGPFGVLAAGLPLSTVTGFRISGGNRVADRVVCSSFPQHSLGWCVAGVSRPIIHVMLSSLGAGMVSLFPQ